SSQIDGFGFYETRYAQWNDESGTTNDKWLDISTLLQSLPNYVECEDDFGVHGAGDPIDVYPGVKNWGPFYDKNVSKRVHKWKGSATTVYSSNYLNFLLEVGDTPNTRMEIVQYVTKLVLADQGNINIGFMQFDAAANGGMVLHPVVPLDDNRVSINDTIDSIKATGNTPLTETYYEAYKYFAGEDWLFGEETTVIGGCPWGTDGPNHCPSRPDTHDNGKYISPIDEPCDRNFIVYLSDGDPVGDKDADPQIRTLTGFDCEDPSNPCIDDLADHMKNNDVNDDIELEQNVRTYTISFLSDHPLLESTAERGGGKYYRADNVAELALAFNQIFNQIREIDFTFVSPTVSVNTFNRLTHNNQLFYTVYRPTLEGIWPGNLKQYKLDYVDDRLTIIDSTNNEAVDPVTDMFLDSAKSFWTLGESDGFDTTKGGFASRLTAVRNIYTQTGADTALAAAENAFHEDNAALTSALLGVADADREALIRWARGVDGAGDPLYQVGDALHSKPVVLSYGGTVDDPDLTLFYSTNTGFMHAIDINGGPADRLERFAYIPNASLAKLAATKSNTFGPKIYDLDGSISTYIVNDDGNGYVNAGETALVGFGMRRGGRGYHAVNVSNRDAPTTQWEIWGGTGDFVELGDTWSKLSPAKVRLDGADRDVYFFAGGYDVNQDTAVPLGDDAVGRAIYMVDALTGNRLWWAANSDDYPAAHLALDDMDYSIPSDLSIIDVNADGFADRIYVGDMGAQLWRIDLNADNTGAANFASGGVIGRFDGAGAANQRRFYYQPSVAFFSDENLGTFLAISIGSGHRANPLGTPGQLIDDRFYMLRDPNIFAPALDVGGDPVYTAVDENDLLDITDTPYPELVDLNSYNGWMISMTSNEKIISAAVAADNRIFFNSYIAGAAGDTTCDPSGAVGRGRNYVVNIGSGSPALDPEAVPSDDDYPGDADCQYRCEDTAFPMPPEPVLVFVEPDPDVASDCQGFADVTAVIGSEVKDTDICVSPTQSFWYEHAK
ncbi:MAG: hypothetical protein HKM24_04280, partial [Gammaproteobacteria bacterium]|nr:hypothetical protein [Gammaproteobacteria bacterium]